MSKGKPKYVKETKKQRAERVAEQAHRRNRSDTWSHNGDKHDHSSKRRKFKQKRAKKYVDV